jgi:hypothetical protein
MGYRDVKKDGCRILNGADRTVTIQEIRGFAAGRERAW